jgi:hypothetical protein
MIYELRIYTTLPGRMPNLLSRFENHTLRIWEKQYVTSDIEAVHSLTIALLHAAVSSKSVSGTVRCLILTQAIIHLSAGTLWLAQMPTI